MSGPTPPVGRRFVKGRSGNPGGKSKAHGELCAVVTALAIEKAPEAISRIVEIMRGDDPRAALAAAQTLLDRALGKVVQSVAVSGDGEGGAILVGGLGPIYGVHTPAET